MTETLDVSFIKTLQIHNDIMEKTSKIKPMEEWLFDRICLLEAIMSKQLHRGEQIDPVMVAERNLLQTMLDIMEG